VCGAVIERRRTRSPNKPWPAAVPHDFVNKWTFKWPSKSDQLIDWRTIRRRRYNNNNNNVLQWSVFLWYYYYYYYYSPPPPPRVTSPVVQIFFCDFFRFSVYIWMCTSVEGHFPPHYINLIFFQDNRDCLPDDDHGATSRETEAEFFTPVPKRICATCIRYIKHARLRS